MCAADWGSGAGRQQVPQAIHSVPTIRALKSRLRGGETLFGSLVSMPSPQLVQLLAGAGLDWLLIDLEHGAISVETAQSMIAATAVAPCTPLVRIAWTVPWLAKPLLDGGAMGVVFPMVRSAEEARAAVSACRYAPDGDRGWGPFYAPSRWGLAPFDYTKAANDAVTVVLLIEHVDAVDHIDAILGVPGIDVAIIAPFDLSVSLGKPGAFDDPVFKSTVERAERAIHGSPAVLGGVAPTPERAKELVGRGYRFVMLGYDTLIVDRAMRGFLDAARA
jgi:4-hydroxy-2-oxoheptanedioate aldolase